MAASSMMMDVAKVGMMKALREIESLQEEVQQLEEVCVCVCVCVCVILHATL